MGNVMSKGFSELSENETLDTNGGILWASFVASVIYYQIVDMRCDKQDLESEARLRELALKRADYGAYSYSY